MWSFDFVGLFSCELISRPIESPHVKSTNIFLSWRIVPAGISQSPNSLLRVLLRQIWLALKTL